MRVRGGQRGCGAPRGGLATHLDREDESHDPLVVLQAAALEQRAAFGAVQVHLPDQLALHLVESHHLAPQVATGLEQHRVERLREHERLRARRRPPRRVHLVHSLRLG